MNKSRKANGVVEKGTRLKPGTRRGLTLWLEGIFTRKERLALGFLIGVSGVGLLLMGLAPIRPLTAPRLQELVVRVNQASASELAALPGVGPKLAGRIVEGRKRGGRFLTLADLKRVKGVTPKTLQKIKGLVRFD